jgi:hypothetical protein
VRGAGLTVPGDGDRGAARRLCGGFRLLHEAAQELKKKKNETEYMKAVEKCMTLKVTEPLKVAFRAWHDRRVPRDPLAHRPEEAEEERGGDHPGQVVDLEVRDQALVGFHWLCRATIRARWIS